MENKDVFEKEVKETESGETETQCTEAEIEVEETADSNLEAIQEELAEQKEGENLDSLQGQLQKKTEECEDLLHRVQRLQADFDNYKKRSNKEKEDFYKYASEKLILGLLPVLDNFERALKAEGEGQDLKAGIEMIFKQFQETLKNEGLSAIEAVGEEFDPNLHQAIMQVEAQEQAENTVVEEFQKGYKLKDKVIRYAMVKVAK